MFGLTDTELQVPAILHKENVPRGEARARITSLFRSPIHSLPTGSWQDSTTLRIRAPGRRRLMRSVARRSHSAPSKSVWRLRLMADVLCHGKIKDRSVRQRSG